MKVEQIYTGCLAQGAYYIVSNGEAVVIDPLRETRPYLERAKKDGVAIKYILETHFHADFVSGHLDLAKATGAQIVYGPTAKPNFDILEASDGMVLKVGDVSLEVLHTPGHTLESSCYLLKDENGKEKALFTGDTLFLGDVGRPDLAVKSDLSREELAGMLYDSLHNKIIPLPDDITIYPGHGAGSACGKNMSSETVDTLANQKANNYALQPMSKQEFVEVVLDGQTAPPAYFPKNVMLNKEGYGSIDSVLETGLVALKPDAFEALANERDALILDTRNENDFTKGFIPNSIFIGIDGSFASWVGTLIADIQQPILVVTDKRREEEVVTRLSRVGYDHSIGYLDGGFEAWREAEKQIDTIASISPDSFMNSAIADEATVLDVRRPGEYLDGHLADAQNVPLDYLNDYMDKLQRNEKYYLHCKGGYRSVIMASILRSRGFENLVNIEGGYDQLKLLTKEEAHIS